jgi:aerobic carbon-monoxide dehydrogenase small subunit
VPGKGARVASTGRFVHNDAPERRLFQPKGRQFLAGTSPIEPNCAEMTEKIEITLNINGHDHTVRVEPRRTLVDVIRDDCGQTGTHIGCEHGICGACTIILDAEAVRACLMFAVQAQGKRIRTVEGLAEGDKLHPLQTSFMAHHALQCGFCTPGFLMLAVNALETNPDITDEEILDVLSSNLCRCTGYQNIIKAVRSTAHEMRRARVA